MESFSVTTEKMEVVNLWGGLIYLVAPPETKVEGAEVTVQKAVLAPYYKSGGCVRDCVVVLHEGLCRESNAHHAAVMKLFAACFWSGLSGLTC